MDKRKKGRKVTRVILWLIFLVALFYGGKYGLKMIKSERVVTINPVEFVKTNPEQEYYEEMIRRAKSSGEYTTYKAKQEKELADNLDAKLHAIAWEYMMNYVTKSMSDFSDKKVQESLNPDSCLRYENRSKSKCIEIMSTSTKGR